MGLGLGLGRLGLGLGFGFWGNRCWTVRVRGEGRGVVSNCFAQPARASGANWPPPCCPRSQWHRAAWPAQGKPMTHVALRCGVVQRGRRRRQPRRHGAKHRRVRAGRRRRRWPTPHLCLLVHSIDGLLHSEGEPTLGRLLLSLDGVLHRCHHLRTQPHTARVARSRTPRVELSRTPRFGTQPHAAGLQRLFACSRKRRVDTHD